MIFFAMWLRYLVRVFYSTMARIAACMKTNISKPFIHDKFLENASDYFSKLFKTEQQVGNLRERLCTHNVFIKDQCFYLNYR